MSTVMPRPQAVSPIPNRCQDQRSILLLVLERNRIARLQVITQVGKGETVSKIGIGCESASLAVFRDDDGMKQGHRFDHAYRLWALLVFERFCKANFG